MAFRSSLFRSIRPAAIARRDRFPAYRVVSVLLGLLLLSAAALKTHQLASDPVLGSSLLESRWFLVAVIQFELLLGFWLFSGRFPRAAWWGSLVTFGAFAVVATGKVIAGEASCGCFGRFPTSPWLALFVDVSALLALWWCRVPRVMYERPPSAAHLVYTGVESRGTSRVIQFAGALLCFVGVWAITAVSLAFFGLRGVESERLPGIGRRIGNLIVVDPDGQIGQPFALRDYIDIGDRLAQGQWLVVLYRNGCPECDALMKQWPDAAGQIPDGVNTAFVCVPPDLPRPKRSLGDVSWGALAADTEWFVTTPTFVALVDNRVVNRWIGLGTDGVRGACWERRERTCWDATYSYLLAGGGST